jgi:hypothetical protein
MFFRLRAGRLLGLSFFLLGLVTYHSYSRHPVLGRWSYPFFAALLGAIGLWIAELIRTWRSGRALASCPSPGAVDLAAALLDIGALGWGVAYLLNSLATPAAAGRIVDLNLFGSVTPVAALVDWFVLVALALACGILVFRRLPTRYANPAVACGAVIVFALAGEGAARVKAIVAPATNGFPTYSGALWYRRYVRFNSDGFRDSPHAPSAEPGTRRLLVIGDSFAFGTGIERVEDRLGEQLGAKLAALTGAHWEVINASRGDLNTLDEIGLLQRTLRYRPDLVILVYVFNDIDYLRPVTQRGVVTEPKTVFQRLHPARLLFVNSYLFQELYVRARLLAQGRASRAARGNAYGDSAVLARHLKDLGRFVALARQAGAVVGIVPFDHTVALGGVIRRSHDTFVNRARMVGLPVWPVDVAFGGSEFSALTVNRLDWHPNELADRLAAERVAEQAVATLERERPSTHLRGKLTRAGAGRGS